MQTFVTISIAIMNSFRSKSQLYFQTYIARVVAPSKETHAFHGFIELFDIH